MVLSFLLSLLNFLEKFLIRLVEFVRIFLVEIFLLIIKSLVNGIYELVLRSLETTFQTECIFVIVSIEGHLSLTGIISSLVNRFWELDLHGVTNLRGSVMLRVWMIEVSPVHHISDIRRIVDPSRLLLHDFMERIGEIPVDVFVGINHLV